MPDIKKKTTILHIITGLGIGGAERVVLELASRMDNSKYRTTVLALDNQCRLLDQYDNSKIIVKSLGMNHAAWSILKVMPAFIRIVFHERPDIIHAHMFHGLLAGLLCRFIWPSSKLVFTSHSYSGFSKLRRLLIRVTKMFRTADVIFQLGQHEDMNAAKTEILPNGVLISSEMPMRLVAKESRRIFFFVGRLESVKNPLGLINSFAAMKHEDCELWLAGDGVLRRQLEDQIKFLGLTDRVKLLGIRNDISLLLREVDCFVMTSKWEGLPIALLEAGAAALPVISTRVGAVPEILGSECGYLVDLDMLPDAMDNVLDDYNEAITRGRRLFERVLNSYSIESMINKHSLLYDSLINE